MARTIGEIIKELRKQRKITQEELAELVGVTPQAISKWERDVGYPDITQIVPLSKAFGVSTDEILGVNFGDDEKQVEDYIFSSYKAIVTDGYERAIEILREAQSKFPHSYLIKVRLANTLISSNFKSKDKAVYKEVINILNYVLEHCTDSGIRNQALDSLATAYDYTGEKEKMMHVVEQMVPFLYSKEQFMLHKWGDFGQEGLEKKQSYLLELFSEMLQCIDLISYHFIDKKPVYSTEEKIIMQKQIVGIVDVLFPDGDYQFHSQQASETCKTLLRLYLEMGDTENSIMWLERACDFSVHFDTYEINHHTTPLLKNIQEAGGIRVDGKSRSEILLQELKEIKGIDKIIDDVRVKTAFLKLEKVKTEEYRLREYLKKH